MVLDACRLCERDVHHYCRSHLQRNCIGVVASIHVHTLDIILVVVMLKRMFLEHEQQNKHAISIRNTLSSVSLNSSRPVSGGKTKPCISHLARLNDMINVHLAAVCPTSDDFIATLTHRIELLAIDLVILD